MQVKALATFHVPGSPEYIEGNQYEVSEALASTLLERQLVEVAHAEPAKEIKEPKEVKSNSPKK